MRGVSGSSVHPVLEETLNKEEKRRMYQEVMPSIGRDIVVHLVAVKVLRKPYADLVAISARAINSKKVRKSILRVVTILTSKFTCGS